MLFTQNNTDNITHIFDSNKNKMIIKNKNHNTVSGTAFIKPWRTGVKSQQLPGGKQNGQRF